MDLISQLYKSLLTNVNRKFLYASGNNKVNQKKTNRFSKYKNIEGDNKWKDTFIFPFFTVLGILLARLAKASDSIKLITK